MSSGLGPIGHHSWRKTRRTWVPSAVGPHPMLEVRVKVDKESYSMRRLPTPKHTQIRRMEALADSGAQMVVMGHEHAEMLGIKCSEYLPAAMHIHVADSRSKRAAGMAILELSAKGLDGVVRTTWQQAYIMDGAEHLYLSYEALRELESLSENYPKAEGNQKGKVSGVEEEGEGQEPRPCNCPDRTLPPPAPLELPFEVDERNIDKLREWIVDRYRASAFNICTHQRLPMVDSAPPLKLHVDPKVKPVVCHKPGNVPLHFQEEVKAGLEKDVRLGVLRKVPTNTPVDSFLHRMVIATKKNGRARRTVDLKPLNRACPRQTHAVEPPFWQASGIPPNTWRTCLDAKEGYHSIPIHPDDQKHTTFLTPWGRFQYRSTPQGHLAAGDGYTQRYDEITADFPDYKRCVDDTCLWAGSIRENFLRTCRYITLCSNNGIVFNVDKFQFCKREVEFLGYTLTEYGMKPTEHMLSSIMEFPRPVDISGIRGWFGLVEQVAWAFSKTKVMEPFRALLKTSTPFLWTQELQDSFETAKQEIVRLVKEGIQSFEMGRVTCATTDWSKVGISFALMQKYCACKEVHPKCCKTGWKLCLVGSRFCSDAESRYAPIEGEALAVCWFLEKARHFVMGIHALVVAVDHRPLLGIFSEHKALADIHNPRLRNFAEKAGRFKFDTVHIKGVENNLSDMMSRHPVGPAAHMEVGALEVAAGEGTSSAGWRALVGWKRLHPTEEEIQRSEDIEAEAVLVAEGALMELQQGALGAVAPRVITWGQLQEETWRDPQCGTLMKVLQSSMLEWPGEVSQWSRYRDDLSVVDGVVLFKERPVIPVVMRPEVLSTLHAGHQGVTSMVARAANSVWWPGINDDLRRVRLGCVQCDTITPSQSMQPPPDLPALHYPFQQIAADYFALEGHHYLVVVDRYSGWPSVHQAKTEDSRELISILKSHFETFGVAEVLSTDGGSQFTSYLVQEFLKTWGCKHRVSSAYFPHSNTRAELGVKSMKRMLRDNIGAGGTLDRTSFSQALLTYRNTPDRDTGRSPAQVVFGRQLRDFIPVVRGNYVPRKEWLLTQSDREVALARRHEVKQEELSRATKTLVPLEVGTVVRLQNQRGPHKQRWDRSGVVIEVLPFSQYKVRVDGTGRVTLRNRVFLRRIIPYVTEAEVQPGDRMHTRLDRGVYQPGVGDTRVTGDDEARVDPAVEEAEVEHAAEEAGSQELPVQQEVTTVRRSARERRQRVMFGSG